MNAFLAQYPNGFYASLAKLQLAKIAAEETRIAATEKARLAEQERARLATEGAQQTQQAKAAADAKAAEAARVAAEKAKQAAQEQATAAEQKRAAADKDAPEAFGMDDGKDHAPAATADQSHETKPDSKIAALPDPRQPAPPSPAELAKSVQTELRRVGCLTGSADGEWNKASRRSLELFNKNAGTRLDVKLASLDALDAIKARTARVCPLICEYGFRADGERCVKITCAAGSFLNDDNECEKRRARTPSARRERDERPARVVRERPQGEASAGKPSGQMVCDRGGCRPVSRGCHLEFRTTAQGGPSKAAAATCRFAIDSSFRDAQTRIQTAATSRFRVRRFARPGMTALKCGYPRLSTCSPSSCPKTCRCKSLPASAWLTAIT